MAYLNYVAGCRAEHKRRREHRRIVEAGRMLAVQAETAGATNPREYGDAVGEALDVLADRVEVRDD
jgi:hypothetical protein